MIPAKKKSQVIRRVFLPVQDYISLANIDNICGYAAPRGPNKGKFCCARATFINEEDKLKSRCVECMEKVGRAAQYIEEYNRLLISGG